MLDPRGSLSCYPCALLCTDHVLFGVCGTVDGALQHMGYSLGPGPRLVGLGHNFEWEGGDSGGPTSHLLHLQTTRSPREKEEPSERQ